jgi:hypothetical protein
VKLAEALERLEASTESSNEELLVSRKQNDKVS